MSQTEVLESLKWMTPFERLAVVEAALKLLREDIEPDNRPMAEEDVEKQMAAAAEALRWDYENDPELTAFTATQMQEINIALANVLSIKS